MQEETSICTPEQFTVAVSYINDEERRSRIEAAARNMRGLAAQIRATIPLVQSQEGKVANKRAYDAISTPPLHEGEARPAYWTSVFQGSYGKRVYIKIYPDMNYSNEITIELELVKVEGKQPRINAAGTVEAMKKKADSLEEEADSLTTAVYAVPGILERLQAFQKAIGEFNALPEAVRKTFSDDARRITGYRSCGLYT